MNQCNDPDHGAINAERAESRGLRKAWVELDDKRQILEKQLAAVTEQLTIAREELNMAREDQAYLHKDLTIAIEQRDELLNFVQKSISQHTLACVSQPEPQTSPWTFHMNNEGKPIITEDSCVCSPEVKAIRRLLKDGKGFNTARIATVKGVADESRN